MLVVKVPKYVTPIRDITITSVGIREVNEVASDVNNT